MIRVGVQTVNSDTLAAVDRRGDEDRIRKTIGYMAEYGIPYSVDHIIGLPGEGVNDQIAAIKFYNEVRPTRIIAHWMTYFPGTTALEQAREKGLLTDGALTRILDGEVGPGYMYEGNVDYPQHEELRRLSNLFDLLPLLPPPAVEWLLEESRYRTLPTSSILRKVGVVGLALKGDRATRERIQHLASSVFEAIEDGIRNKTRTALANNV
jgi:anaerobic magnesium-protoporphyrin IX monomethyl ester cyclase